MRSASISAREYKGSRPKCFRSDVVRKAKRERTMDLSGSAKMYLEWLGETEQHRLRLSTREQLLDGSAEALYIFSHSAHGRTSFYGKTTKIDAQRSNVFLFKFSSRASLTESSAMTENRFFV